MYHLELKGTHKQWGESHGEEFKTQIKELLEIRHELLYKFLPHLEKEDIKMRIKGQIDQLSKHTALYAEFKGISDASGISLEDTMILNNYTDMRDFGTDQGCSTVTFRTNTQKLCGQTWDMHASARPYVLHLSVNEGVQEEVLTVVGCLGLAGVSSHNTSVMINNMHCKETSNGLMWPALVRGMLGQSSADLAYTYLKNNIPSSGHNYLICDEKESINVETTGKQIVETYRSGLPGVHFHTNHYVSELTKLENLSRQSKTTHARYGALEFYFNKVDHESITFNKITQDVFNGKEAKAVCIKPQPDPHAGMTCGGIVVDLNARKGVMFAGLYEENDHHELSW
jgi:isopenicillin-N N-acyltransferase like protein